MIATVPGEVALATTPSPPGRGPTTRIPLGPAQVPSRGTEQKKMVINKILIAATSVLAMSGIIQARAESNGLALVERPATTGTVLSSPALTDTGSETYQSFAGPSVPVVSGQVLQ